MPNINLLPQKSPILKARWILNSLFLIGVSSIFLFCFKQYQKKPNLATVSRKTSNIPAKGLLNTYFLHQLSVVGFLTSHQPGSVSLGLIKSPDQKISMIKQGDYIAREKAKVMSIEDTRITLQLSDQITKRFMHLSN